MTTFTGGRADGRALAEVSPLLLVLVTGPVVLALGVAVVLVSGSGDGLTAWWPAAAPAAVAVARVLRGPVARGMATRPLLLVGVLAGIGLGSLASRLLVGRYTGLIIGWALADVGHAVVAGLVLASGAGLALRTVPDLVRLAGAAVSGGVAAACVATLVGLPPLLNGSLGLLFCEVAASRVAAVLLLAPLLLGLPWRPRDGPVLGTVLGAALSWVLVLGATLLVFAPPGAQPLAFLSPAFLVVAALRQSPRTTAAQTAVVGVLVAVATARGSGPFAASGPVSPLLVQAFLVVCSLAVLTVALVTSARERGRRSLDGLRRFDRAVLESVAAGVLAADADGRVVLRNAAYRSASGDPPDGGADPGALRPHERDLVARALNGEHLRGVTHRPDPAAGPPRDLVAHASPILSPDGRLLGAVASFTDVTEERAVQARLREAITFHDAVLAASPDVIFIVDVATHRVVWASGTVEPTLGYTPRQVVELDRASRLNVVHPEDVEALHAADDAAARMRDGQVQTVRVRMSNERGDLRWMSRRVTPFTRGPGGRVVQLLGVVRDVTDVVEVERRLTDAANRDPLTGLLNRRALLDRLAVLVDRARDAGAAPTPVLFCDLDGFKAVNDSLGHAAGDVLLTTVAQRIAGALRDGDVLARAGGDEFVLLLETPPSRTVETRSDVLHRARTVARRILETVARPLDVYDSRLAVTVSIGIALVRPGIGPGEVLRDADAAMYRAKSTGKNRLHVFEVAPDRRTDRP